MRLTLRQAGSLALPIMFLLASNCTKLAATPPRADLMAATEKKPVPSDDIADDPVAFANHQASIDSWGDRLFDAGGRLCRFFKRTSMKDLDCPPAPE